MFSNYYGLRENVEGMLTALGLQFIVWHCIGIVLLYGITLEMLFIVINSPLMTVHQGRPHRGIDDTVNIARIAIQVSSYSFAFPFC